VLPECEIPDPTEQELAALVNGTRSPLNFVQQYKACLENLNRLSTIDDFSAALDRRMKRADRRFKILVSLGYPAVLPELTGPNLPAPRVGFAKFLTKVVSLPTAANVAGQTFALITTGIATWGDDSPQAKKLRADVFRRFESSLWEFGKDKFFDAMGKYVGERTFGQPPLPGSELLGGNVQAGLEVADVINEANARVAESENKPDPKGAAGSNVEDVPSYPPTKTIDGVVKDSSGNPQEGSSIALCPPLPGQSNPPLSKSPTYSDGSYVLVMPVNFDEPDKVCKVVLKTPGQPDDTVVTDISQPAKEINFPESSAPKDELLYGQAVGAGNVPGCGPVGEIGLTKMRLLLPNTSLYDLARNGGSTSGITTYTGVSAGFQPGNCKPEYFSETKYDVPVSVKVEAGGAGVLRITGDRDYQVQVTSSGITGSVAVSTCGTAGMNCKFNLELQRFK